MCRLGFLHHECIEASGLALIVVYCCHCWYCCHHVIPDAAIVVAGVVAVRENPLNKSKQTNKHKSMQTRGDRYPVSVCH